MASKFTHFHVHSHYSLLDGLPKIPDLVAHVKKLGMDAVAVTDHGVLYGAVEFFKEGKKQGIKPIIGCELYMAYERMDQKRPRIDDKRYHLVLLAKNKKGYENLVHLVTRGHLEGFYYKPRIDDNLLAKHAEGLIALSGCIQGKISQLIISNRFEEAEKKALEYQQLFGEGNFYLEIQHHPSLTGQVKANPQLIKIAKKHGIPLVATNDSHYLNSKDKEAQDVLLLINTGSDKDDSGRLTMLSDDYSVPSPEKMAENFKHVPSAITNTEKIKEACNFEFELGKIILPKFEPPQGTSTEYLEKLCRQGIRKRYADSLPEGLEERLTEELSVIKDMGFNNYFLIVQDFVRWAKENNIAVGPARGSVAGSLVSYLIGITEVDPLKYGLIFERFLNKARVSMPDIDLDFADTRRDEVIEYVQEKYGKDKVAQIITFGTMAARAVIRDVGRALKYSYDYCDAIAKMVPLGFSLEQCLNGVQEFIQLYEQDERARTLIDFAKKLEGVARHASTHACAIVISRDPLEKIVPLQYSSQNDKTIITQYDMHGAEDLGLLKMDFLGLKNLTTIEETIALVKERKGEDIDIEKLSFDDAETFDLIQKAKTTSIFQLESQGMKSYLKALKPTQFEDIIAMVALYRPGPMEFIPKFIKRKHGEERVDYLHPKLEPILKDTYGICVFQEQLMRIATDVAGFTLSEADILRKAIGKKIKTLLDKQKVKFLDGAIKNGVKRDTAQRLWQWILPFAQYGFNKCLTGDTEIIDADTGQLIKIKDLYLKKEKIKNTITCDTDRLKMKKEKVLRVMDNGVNPVYKITTEAGKSIEATANHPFYTFGKWRRLDELKKGDLIATPRKLPIQGKEVWPKHEVIALGHLLAEGNLCHPHSVYFYSQKEKYVKDYIKAAESFENVSCSTSIHKNTFYVYAKRINRKHPPGIVSWAKRLDIWGKSARQKEIPKQVFSLQDTQIALLISRMWEGDGHISSTGACPYYATSSKKMAHQIQHLLLRLEILSRLRKAVFSSKKFIGYQIHITGQENITRFEKYIGKYFVDKNKRNHLKKAIIKANSEAIGTKDIIPLAIKKLVRTAKEKSGIGWREFNKQSGIAQREFLPTNSAGKIGFRRNTIARVANYFESNEIKKHAESDIYWDRISKIKYIGKKQTYDLEIPKTHNFIANDIMVHNSHATAYAMIAYQTAYLKTHYPLEFMTGVLVSEKADIERTAVLIEECKSMGINVLRPDINESEKKFTAVGKNSIRFGLSAIKNVGERAVEQIVSERKANGQFKSISDFALRVSGSALNKKTVESMVKAGAFDKLGERQKLLNGMPHLLKWARQQQSFEAQGQQSLFSGGGKSIQALEIKLEEVPPARKAEKLKWEKELLGLYVTSHPLEPFTNLFKEKALPIQQLGQSIQKRVCIGGIISGIRKILTKNGDPMMFATLEDKTGKIDVVVFPKTLKKNGHSLEQDKIVFMSGKVDERKGRTQLICDSVEEIIDSK